MLGITALASVGWVASSQSIFGAQAEQIADQLAGVPLPAGRNWQTQLGSMWTCPAEVDDLTGLGGGITYAWDPELCDKLMPIFREDIAGMSFIDCTDAQSAVFRAFNAWAANSRFLKFIDVTGECEKMGLLHGGQTEQPHGGCPIAEIWITTIARDERRRRRAQDAEEGEELTFVEEADQGLDSGSFYVATALSHWRVSHDFRYTNGDTAFQWVSSNGAWTKQPRPVLETYAGTFAFGVDGESNGVPLCWYLDSHFCSGFHKLKGMSGPAASRALMISIFSAVTVLTLLWCMGAKHQFWRALCGCGVSTAEYKRREGDLEAIENDMRKSSVFANPGDFEGVKQTTSKRLVNAFEEAAEWNPLGVALQVMLIISPPIVLTQIILPCWDCYDFEAATLHEIGHFLGLGHPDNIPDNMRLDLAWVESQGLASNVYQADVASGMRPNASNCHSLWDHVYNGVPAGAELNEKRAEGLYPLRNAIMQAFTQHNPQPCLTDDDVEGIATLYPDCSAHSISKTVCHKVNHNIGVVRIAVYVLVPMLVTLIVMMAFAAYMHNYHEEAAEDAAAEVRQLKKQLKAAKAARRSAKQLNRANKGRGGGSAYDPSDEYPPEPARLPAPQPSVGGMAMQELPYGAAGADYYERRQCC